MRLFHIKRQWWPLQLPLGERTSYDVFVKKRDFLRFEQAVNGGRGVFRGESWNKWFTESQGISLKAWKVFSAKMGKPKHLVTQKYYIYGTQPFKKVKLPPMSTGSESVWWIYQGLINKTLLRVLWGAHLILKLRPRKGPILFHGVFFRVSTKERFSQSIWVEGPKC